MRFWVFLIGAFAAILGVGNAQASTYTFSSTVQVSGLTQTIPGPPEGTNCQGQCAPTTVYETRWISASPFDFRSQPFALVDHFTSVSLTLTIFDGDTGTHDYDYRHLYLYFNNINGRWWANGFSDDQTVTKTLVNPLTDFLDTWPLIEESFRQLGTIYVGLLDDTPETPNDLNFAAPDHPIATLTITAELIDVPEPSSFALLLACLCAIGAMRVRWVSPPKFAQHRERRTITSPFPRASRAGPFPLPRFAAEKETTS